jgi:uncharacterized surface protein with fasciclin (FAS1) repeats
MESHGNKAAIAIVTMVIGLAVGGGVGYAVADMNKNDDKSSNSNTSMNMDSGSDGVTVGGAKMVKDKDIVDNAVNAKNVTTVVSLVQKAGLVDTLKSDGPFTVFAPNNDAFAKLPAETVASLQEEANVEQLKTILTYHVVAGTYTSADLKVMAQKGESLTTVQGQTLMPVLEDNMVKLMDASGNTVDIETSDVISSNGVTHVIKSVLMPKS